MLTMLEELYDTLNVQVGQELINKMRQKTAFFRISCYVQDV